MRILTLALLLFAASSLMLFGIHVFLKGASHLKVHSRLAVQDGSSARERLFSSGMLSGLLCPGVTVRALYALERSGRGTPSALSICTAGACLPFWLPLAALLPMPCGILFTLVGFALIRFSFLKDPAVFVGRMLAGLGCCVLGCAFFRRFAPAVSSGFYPESFSFTGGLLPVLFAACAAFLLDGAEIPCAAAALLASVGLLSPRLCFLAAGASMFGAAFPLPLSLPGSRCWRAATVRMYVFHRFLCALLFVLPAFLFPFGVFLQSPPRYSLVIAVLMAFIPVLSSLLLFGTASWKRTKDGMDLPPKSLPAVREIPVFLPGLGFALLHREFTDAARFLRSRLVEAMNGSLPATDVTPDDEPNESFQSRCRGMAESCVGLMQQSLSRSEAVACSLYLSFASGFEQLLEAAACLDRAPDASGPEPDPDLTRSEAPVPRPVPLMPLLSLMDDCLGALNEIRLGHPCAAGLSEKGKEILSSLEEQAAPEADMETAPLLDKPALRQTALVLVSLASRVEGSSALLSGGNAEFPV